MGGTLVLVRHGQSEWNEKNLFTGWADPGLTDKGIREAVRAGRLLKERGYKFDMAYTSVLSRAQHTLTLMLDELDQQGLKTVFDKALNERNYGDLIGLNKDDARKKWGDEQVHQWRRSFDTPPPGGESLKDTADRVLPYYHAHIEPKVKDGGTILVSAHGNSLRALVMFLEGLSRQEILAREIATGVPLIYEIDKTGKVVSHAILS